jgi:hypothetical protein
MNRGTTREIELMTIVNFTFFVTPISPCMVGNNIAYMSAKQGSKSIKVFSLLDLSSTQGGNKALF